MGFTAKKLPVGIQTFEKLRTEGYVYVDKTDLIHKIVTEGQYYFLSRPRCFGKSLLLTTIQAYFEGRKDLFEGLEIARLEKEWIKYPVILISLARYNPGETDSLEKILDSNFSRLEKKYGTDAKSDNLSIRFGDIIEAAYKQTGRKVVVLVDEYDAPMIANLKDKEKHDRHRDLLKSIYSNLKDMDAIIRFGMLTGVTRFSRMSIFSGINNLDDISMIPQYSRICGISEAEIDEYFTDGVDRLALQLSTDREGARKMLKENYDGYHFTENPVDLYNPYSLIKCLAYSKIDSYWFATGTLTFLVELIRESGAFVPELFTDVVHSSSLSDIETFQHHPVTLLFQTGYLTIRSYDKEDNVYTLKIPNKEVREGLCSSLLAELMGDSRENNFKCMLAIRKAFRAGLLREALERTKSFLSGIPYDLTQNKPEIYFENNLYLLYTLVGLNTRAEWRTASGRIDMLIEMPDYVYVMELKLDGTAADALRQIDDKEYAFTWKYDGRRIFRIGINFSKATRNIDSWEIGD